MLDKGGAIVNIASMAGLIPSPLRGAYSVSKAGVLMLTQLTAYEWGKRKVRANAVCPGYINTPMNAHIFVNSEERRRREKLIPYGRLGTPEDVAKAVYFLASPESEYMNGEFLRVDGGFAVAAMPQIDADGRMI
jgi:NAD(P)-dependent dehydrogenase (short-subunit alcohol dehydrogenase family)